MEVNLSSEADVLSILEERKYLTLNDGNCSNVKTKITEFSEFLNGVGRLSLLHGDKLESEEFIYLLLALEKSIINILSEISSVNKKNDSYVCSRCNETINIDPRKNFWECLQSHEHFEDLYNEFLSSTLKLNIPVNVTTSLNDTISNSVPSTSQFEFTYENTDSGIDNEICDGERNGFFDATERNETNEEDGVNTFKFNFSLKYDELIENKIYPSNLMKSVRKIDQIKEHTVQKTGPIRAVCLLCPCDLISKNKISKFAIEDHVMGQRHIKNSKNPDNVNSLQTYHKLWLNMDVNYQAHQVYFRPMPPASLKCELCNVLVKHNNNNHNIYAHIDSNRHSKKTIELYEKKSTVYYLIEQQIQAYGIKSTPVATKINEVKKQKPPAKPKVRVEKTDSDSSPSSDVKESKHTIIKSVENSTSENVLDLIPHRFKEHLKHLNTNENTVTCNICGITLDKDIVQIKKHIKSVSHTLAANIPPIKYNYFCEICNAKFPDEDAWIKHFTVGPNGHAKMGEVRRQQTTEYECIKCCTVIFGDEMSLTRHLSIKREKQSKEVKLPPTVLKLLKSKEAIEAEGERLASEANDTLRYNRLTKECCDRLEATLGTIFEGCRAYPFGSRISGLGDQYSDLDVFIDTGDMYTGNKNQDALSQIQLVRNAASVLIKHRDEFHGVFQIPTARTPIVKLLHNPTKIECDLSFRHGLSVENTKFLRFCLDLQPIAQPCILLLKKWLQHNNLNEHISTYALAVMAIFYLQINGHLMSVKRLRELNSKKSLVINGWNTINYTIPLDNMKKFVEPYPYGVVKLLKDFFSYYAKFKYSDDVICPLMGHTIKKKQFPNKSLPKEMTSYVAQLHSEEPEEFRASSVICIQDPFDLSHNLTKACQLGTLNKFKKLCDLTFKQLD